MRPRTPTTTSRASDRGPTATRGADCLRRPRVATSRGAARSWTAVDVCRRSGDAPGLVEVAPAGHGGDLRRGPIAAGLHGVHPRLLPNLLGIGSVRERLA